MFGPANSSRPIQPALSLYDALLVVLLAAGWLLPNHYPPWSSFHSNAWVAGFLILMALRALWLRRPSIGLGVADILLLVLSFIPLAQYAGGLIPVPNTALLSWLYVLGFALAVVIGRAWAQAEPDAPARQVLAAAALAALVSTALAIYQWVGLTEKDGLTDIWVMYLEPGGRPYANLGQPNQLATLLLLGLLGVVLLRLAGRSSGATSAVAVGFILFGVALTESRTALLTLTLATVFVLAQRKFRLAAAVKSRVAAYYAFYLLALFGHSAVGRLFGIDSASTLVTRTNGEVRFALWKMAWDATTVSPWVGFGIDRSNEGFFQVFQQHPALANLYFEQSHNLILDFVLWFGWPLGLMLTAALVFWFVRCLQVIESTQQLATLGAIFALLVHAMLEFPHHYGYFLWPMGMLIGSVSAAFRPKIFFAVPWQAAASGLVALGVTLAVLVHDYLNVEASFTELRFEIARIGPKPDDAPPEVWLLTDWPRAIALPRATPRKGMTDAEIREWESLLYFHTSPLVLRKVVGALMLNDRPDEARAWALRSCWLLSAPVCKLVIDEWHVPMEASAAARTGS